MRDPATPGQINSWAVFRLTLPCVPPYLHSRYVDLPCLACLAMVPCRAPRGLALDGLAWFCVVTPPEFLPSTLRGLLSLLLRRQFQLPSFYISSYYIIFLLIFMLAFILITAKGSHEATLALQDLQSPVSSEVFPSIWRPASKDARSLFPKYLHEFIFIFIVLNPKKPSRKSPCKRPAHTRATTTWSH